MSNVAYLITHRLSLLDPARVNTLNTKLSRGEIARVYVKLPGDIFGASSMLELAKKARPYASVRVLRDAKPRYLSLVVTYRQPDTEPSGPTRRAA